MTQPEASFKKHLREGFEACHQAHPHYWLPLVASVFQKAGIPDLFVADGKIGAWIEAKVNGNGLSALQALEMRKMGMAGIIVVVVHADLSVDKATRVIDRSVFTRDGMLTYQPNCVYWNDHKEPGFWRALIHG